MRVVVAIAWNSLTCMVHVCDDEPPRLVPEQEKHAKQREWNEPLDSPAHYKALVHHHEQGERQNVVKDLEKSSSTD